jgi:DNA mismatch repair protein MutS2
MDRDTRTATETMSKSLQKTYDHIHFTQMDWNELLARLSALATSEHTREKLKTLGAHDSQDTAQTMMNEIQEWIHVLSTEVRPRAESLDLFTPWFQRLARNAVLKTLELRDVRHFCIEIVALKDILAEMVKTQLPHLQDIEARLMDATEPLSAIDQIMTTAGDIRTDASEKLYQLHNEKTQLARQMQSILDRLVKSYKIEHLLQDRYVTTREGRWVLPIRSGMQHGFEGIIHDSSQTKQTVFMEPQEAVPLNNRLREIEIEIELEIERLLTELSQYLSHRRMDFQDAKNILLLADERLAEADLSRRLQANPPELSTDTILLTNVRHPLLVLNGSEVIPNSVELNANERILLLSGPNAGGKTVLLKSVGLAAQMARCGLPICADNGSHLPFFTEMIVALGDSQSVDANLSTFAAHLKNLERAAAASGPNVLILIDEICGSTDPEEGAALARSFIDTYCANKVFGVITSHLGALKSGWGDNSGLVNGSLEFSKERGPTYRFIKGVPGQSLAIQTAKRVGIKSEIIDRALSYMTPERRKYEETLDEIEQMKKGILLLQDQMNRDIKLAAKEKEKYQTELKKLADEREEVLEKETRAAQKRVDELLQEVKAQDIFRRHDSLQKIKFELPQIVKSSDIAKNEKSQPLRAGSPDSKITSAVEFTQNFPPGSSVHIETLGRDGIVQGKPNARDEVPILSNSMRLMVDWRFLKSTSQSNSMPARLKKLGRFKFASADSDRVVDVRGFSVDEAISQLEIQLDTSALGGEDRIKIVHGHGTDALKRAVRSYLSRSIYVKKWLAGTADTGGDGVTWVELKE